MNVNLQKILPVSFKNMNQIINNTAIILAEILIILLLFYLLNLLTNKFYHQCMKVTWLQKGEKTAFSIKKTTQKILIIFTVACSLLVVAINSWLWYKGNDLGSYTYQLLSAVPQEIWLNLLTGTLLSLLVIILAIILLRNLHQGIDKLCDRTLTVERFNGSFCFGLFEEIKTINLPMTVFTPIYSFSYCGSVSFNLASRDRPLLHRVVKLLKS